MMLKILVKSVYKQNNLHGINALDGYLIQFRLLLIVHYMMNPGHLAPDGVLTTCVY